MASTAQAPPVVGILSIGDMGAGIARLLAAKGFTVVTNCTGRSEDTILRAQQAGVQLLEDDTSLVQQADVILSIVPPRNAQATAERIIAAFLPSRPKHRSVLVYADLNAVSPATTKSIASLFPEEVAFVDGAIIGGPPHLQNPEEGEKWYIPQIPTSGPHPLPASLATALSSKHISPDLGAASGLKMCFASLTKGFTALAIQAYSSAERLGVLEELTDAVETTIPSMKGRIAAGMTGMPPKAYRWVREMEEIGITHRDAGWDGEAMFQGAAGVYRFVAEGTVLGAEKVGKRERGTSVGDVARAVGEGLGDREKLKKE